MATVQQIYCDESGFTGNNLLNVNQPCFVYASVATTSQEAGEVKARVLKDLKVVGTELKGSKLLRYNKGRMAVYEILKKLKDQSKAIVFDKKYALACKFFEYIFEPTISDNNYIFYNIGFHRFISTLLYIHLQARAEMAEELFQEFEQLMRNKDFQGLHSLFNPSAIQNEESKILRNVIDFAVQQHEPIEEELNRLKDTEVGKWILDLSSTALFTLLADWGQHYDQLQVYCDRSAPLEKQQEIFDVMIGRTDKQYSPMIGGKQHPITFNLLEPLKFVDSVDYSGIQLADVIAAAVACFLMAPRDDTYRKDTAEHMTAIISDSSNLPNPDRIDLSRFEAKRNAVVLEELVERSREGRDLLDGMGYFIEVANRTLPR